MDAKPGIAMIIHSSVAALFSTPWFWSALSGWMLAQLCKLTAVLITERRLDIGYFVSTGGMPSAHSAMVSALATSISLTEGFGTPIAVLTWCFAGVTMFDAAGVRNAADFDRLCDHLRAFDDEPLTVKDYEEAARCFNICRSAGVAGSNVDFLLCAAAIRRHIPIFTTDVDFDLYAKRLPIRRYEPHLP